MKFVNFNDGVSVHIQNEKVGYRDFTLCGKQISNRKQRLLKPQQDKSWLAELGEADVIHLRSVCRSCEKVTNKFVEAIETLKEYKVSGLL
jgi:hypothetical protein